MVSDVARVLVSKSLFDRLIENLDKADCITPALKVADTTLFENEALQRENQTHSNLKFHALAYSNKP